VSRLNRIRDTAVGMRAMRRAREREYWPPERMREHQASALAALVADVASRSPFHRSRLTPHVDRDGSVDLAALPTLGKATLMGNLDDALCDSRLRGLDLHAHLLDDEPVLGEYRVMASSGSTGTPGLYIYSRSDWTGLLANFFRYAEIGGIRPRLPRLRIAGIGAPSRASMTRRVAESIDIGLHRMLRLSVRDPLPEIVAALNSFRPDAMNVYPSVAALLADEQLAGRLRISPRVMSTSSEMRTPEMTERIERAFGIRPFNLYGTSEGLWGVECEHHQGIHLFEDWCIAENVDMDGRPVPDGEPGARLLITNLFNRTLPLIRFEVSDVVAIERGTCACGRTLPRLQAVEGRLDDILYLPGRDGNEVTVHPSQFSFIAARPGVREFQLVQRREEILVRLVLGETAASDTAAQVVEAVTGLLDSLGVRDPDVRAEPVPPIERTAAGKLKMVVKEEPAGEGG